MRSPRPLGGLTAALLLVTACSGGLPEERARRAAEETRRTIQPLDAGAMEQEIDAETVREVQERLTALEEYLGPISGKLDPVTLNALEAFQRSRDITADGRFNEQTLAALGVGGAP